MKNEWLETDTKPKFSPQYIQEWKKYLLNKQFNWIKDQQEKIAKYLEDKKCKTNG